MPVPIIEYRKVRFWRSPPSLIEVNVPRSASEATMPRTVSSAKRRSRISPSGTVVSSRNVAGSRASEMPRSVGSGCSIVGHTTRVSAATSP